MPQELDDSETSVNTTDSSKEVHSNIRINNSLANMDIESTHFKEFEPGLVSSTPTKPHKKRKRRNSRNAPGNCSPIKTPLICENSIKSTKSCVRRLNTSNIGTDTSIKYVLVDNNDSSNVEVERL